MPLWSVEEWRARIGSSWAAVGRQAVRCSSHYSCSKQRRHYVQCCPALGGGGLGGGVLVATILSMMTTITLLVHSMSLIIVHPMEPGYSTKLHSGSRMCYQGSKGSVWSYMKICHLFPRDLFVSINRVQPTTGSGYIVSALAIAIVVAMSLETAAAVQASLLLRCGDIEPNPGPLTREDLETVDNICVLSEDDMRDIRQEVLSIKSTYYQFGIALGLPIGELDAIRRSFHQVIDQAFDEVLLLWLRQLYDVGRHGHPTWRRLVEVVDSPNGGKNPALAMAIASRHPLSGPSTKRVKLSRPGPPAPTPCASSEGTPPSLDHWRQLLIDFYLASHDLSDAWPPLKTIQFVQLALVQQKDNARHIGLKTVTRDIDAVYGHKINTSLFNIFTNLERSSLYLLEGRPGSGKTTLMIHLTQQWAKGKLLITQSIKLVFLVQLRRLGGREDVCLEDLLQVACSDFSTDSEDMREIIDYITKKRGEGVVFALDGFDEYVPGQNPGNFISRLIMKKLFCRSIVVVSSRPAATQPFRHVASKWIEVVGFFKEQVMQYVRCYSEQNGEVEKAQQLIQHLEEHPNLMNLCYLPLHCAMLVFLYEEDNVLPNTETEFYHEFTLSLLRRSSYKQNEHLDPSCEVIRSFNHLPDSRRKSFERVCKLAFEATVASQQVFKKSQIDQICFDGAVECSLGLVVIDRYFVRHGIDETYTFLHLTLQEYLAAVHIAGLSESEQTYIVSRHCKDKHLHVTWRFLFGILDYSKESTVKLFKLILDATSDDCLLHIQCAYESQHSAACTDVLHHHKNSLKFTNIAAIRPFDVMCITYVFKTAMYTTNMLEFVDCNFSADDAVALLKGVGDHQLSLIVHKGEAVQSVLDALSLVTVPGLIELNLWAARGGGGVSVKSHLKLSSNLHKLSLDGIDITNSGLEEGLKHWPNLEELDIQYTSCPLTVLGAIKHCTNLVKFTLFSLNLDVSEARALGQSLRFTSKLHSINLNSNRFGDDGFQAVAKGIKNCKELKELHLACNRLTDKSIPHLIKLARNLEKLDLHENDFTREGVEQIREAVSKRNSVGDMTELTLLISVPL